MEKKIARESLRRHAGAGTRWTAGAALAIAMFELLQLVVLSRLLDPAQFGLFALVALVLGLAQSYSDLGMSNAIIHRRDVSTEQLSSMFWLDVAAALSIFLVLQLLAPLAARLFREQGLAALIRLGALVFLFAPLTQQFSAILQKSLQFRSLAVADAASGAAGAAVAIGLAANGQGVVSLVWGLVANAATKGLVLGLVGSRTWRPSLRLRRSDLAGYLRFGAYQMGERTVNYLGFNLDRLLIGALIGTYGLGLYSVASQLVMKPIQILSPIVTRVTFPLFAIMQADEGRLRVAFLDSVRAVALVLFPLYAGLVVLAQPFVELLLGAHWVPAIPVLRLLCGLGIFYSIGKLIGPLLLAKGRVELGFFLNLWAIALNGAAIWIGARWGVTGIAAALVIATAFGLFPVGFRLRRILVGMQPAQYLASLAPALASAAIMGAAVLAARIFGPRYAHPAAELALLGFAGAALYAAIAAVLQRPFLVRLFAMLR